MKGNEKYKRSIFKESIGNKLKTKVGLLKNFQKMRLLTNNKK